MQQPEIDTTEKLGQLNLNQPISSEEEQKAQAAIDDILGGFQSKPQAPVEVKDLDTDKLFNFAGMDTNRTDGLPGAAGANPAAQAFDAPAQ